MRQAEQQATTTQARTQTSAPCTHPAAKAPWGHRPAATDLPAERKADKDKAETATCHAKTNQGPHAFANPWCKKGCPESQHNCSSSDYPSRMTDTDLTSLTETLPWQSPAQEPIESMDSLLATGLGRAVPCFGCFFGQIRKKVEAEKSDPAIIWAVLTLPRASWSMALADPLLKYEMLLHAPKTQPSTEWLISCRAAACHVCYPCQNPEFRPIVEGQRRALLKYTKCQITFLHSRTKPLEIFSLLGSLDPHESSLFLG